MIHDNLNYCESLSLEISTEHVQLNLIGLYTDILSFLGPLKQKSGNAAKQYLAKFQQVWNMLERENVNTETNFLCLKAYFIFCRIIKMFQFSEPSAQQRKEHKINELTDPPLFVKNCYRCYSEFCWSVHDYNILYKIQWQQLSLYLLQENFNWFLWGLLVHKFMQKWHYASFLESTCTSNEWIKNTLIWLSKYCQGYLTIHWFNHCMNDVSLFCGWQI